VCGMYARPPTALPAFWLSTPMFERLLAWHQKVRAARLHSQASRDDLALEARNTMQRARLRVMQHERNGRVDELTRAATAGAMPADCERLARDIHQANESIARAQDELDEGVEAHNEALDTLREAREASRGARGASTAKARLALAQGQVRLGKMRTAGHGRRDAVKMAEAQDTLRVAALGRRANATFQKAGGKLRNQIVDAEAALDADARHAEPLADQRDALREVQGELDEVRGKRRLEAGGGADGADDAGGDPVRAIMARAQRAALRAYVPSRASAVGVGAPAACAAQPLAP
jgi:hypothetical protein